MKYAMTWTRRGEAYQTGPLLIAGESHPPIRIACVSHRVHRTPDGYRTSATWRMEWGGATKNFSSLRDAKEYAGSTVGAMMRAGRVAVSA